MAPAASQLGRLRSAVLGTTGWDAKRFFGSALAANAGRLLDARLARSRYRAFLEAEDLRDHYADIEVADDANRRILLSFITARLQFIDDCLGADEPRRASFIDVGDSSGVFLRALGKTGVARNSSEGCANSILAKGAAAVRGDAVRLPLRDGACDYVLCFETLEHLTSPIEALRELWRVSRKGAFISVPHVSVTKVKAANSYDVPQELIHIFELSEPHWRALLTHTPFRVVRGESVPVIDEGHDVHERVAQAIWRRLYGDDTFCGTFKRFLLFYLAKS